MPLKAVPGEMLLVLISRDVVVKMSESPGLGTMPPQFAAVLQLSSVPPPVHVTVAARPGTSAAKRARIANRAVFIDSVHHTVAVWD
jgi:hypothetical protein